MMCSCCHLPVGKDKGARSATATARIMPVDPQVVAGAVKASITLMIPLLLAVAHSFKILRFHVGTVPVVPTENPTLRAIPGVRSRVARSTTTSHNL